MEMRDVALRAFRAQAVCDALAYPFEFKVPSLEALDAHLKSDSPVVISDDTQMALFGLEALARAKFAQVIGTAPPEIISSQFVLPAYSLWYFTQGLLRQRILSKRQKALVQEVPSYLMHEKQMYYTRAPGVTCIAALSEYTRLGHRKPNTSKGNGAVMRTLPFLFAPSLIGMDNGEALTLAIISGRCTHDHMASSKAVDLYMKLGLEFFSLPTEGYAGHMRTKILDLAEDFIDEGPALITGEYSAIHRRYNSGTALGAFYSSLWLLHAVAGKSEAYYELIHTASRVDGDSDTVAAIAGGLLGIVQEPPEAMVARVEERAIIDSLVDIAFSDDAPEVFKTIVV